MGEVRTRRLVASGLVMLLVLLVPVSAEENTDLHLEIEIIDENSKPWYGTGDTVVLTSSIINNGDATSVTEDPSCGTILSITNDKGETILDGTQTCRGQNRGLDVGSGTTNLETFEWALDDADGNLVTPGMYVLTVELFGSGLSSNVEIMVQQSANLPDELIYSTSLSHRGENLEPGQPFVILYEAYNPSSETIDLSNHASCQLLLEYDSSALGPHCNAGFSSIEPHSFISLGHTMFQAQSGISSLSIQTPDNAIIDTYEFNISGQTEDTIPLNSAITALSNDFIEGQILDASITIENPGNEEHLMRFTNTCRTNYWVADYSGNVIFDSLQNFPCNDAIFDVVIGSGSKATLPLQSWSFVNQLGCSITSGDYVLVAEVNEFGYAASQNFEYQRIYSSDCGYNVEPDISLTIEDSYAGHPEIAAELAFEQGPFDIRWINECRILFEIWNLDSNEPVAIDRDICLDENGVNLPTRIDSDTVLTYRLQGLHEYDFTTGNYSLLVEFRTDSELYSIEEFTWPLIDQQGQPDSQDTNSFPVESETFTVSGVWSGYLTPDGTCWMIEDEAGTIHMLADSTIPTWLPQRGTYGVYDAVPSEANAACTRFTAESFVLNNIVEELPVVDEEPVVIEELTVVEQEDEEGEFYPEWAPQAITVLTVSALLSMLGFAAFNNEAIRITTTLTGLWLLGLIGKTSETSDGRFQRGRLLGYLTANPGCHFRALLSALEMSNGQLSHHLRVLEQEESIWRRKDGRLVRYYPLTNTLHPLLEDDVLPVPILAPDPLSLQGKILLLLDHDSQMGDFPTQAELAKRLDKSQQLISHHLRTLEKYGLIEGRRMGMRNRYKLTKEALFLLETSDAYVQNEMNL